MKAISLYIFLRVTRSRYWTILKVQVTFHCLLAQSLFLKINE